MFIISLSNIFTVFFSNLSGRCFCWFPAAMLVPTLMGSKHGASIQIPINLVKKRCKSNVLKM